MDDWEENERHHLGDLLNDPNVRSSDVVNLAFSLRRRKEQNERDDRSSIAPAWLKVGRAAKRRDARRRENHFIEEGLADLRTIYLDHLLVGTVRYQGWQCAGNRQSNSQHPPRFWGNFAEACRGDVLAHIDLSERRIFAVELDDIRRALNTAAAEDRKFASEAPIVVQRATDQSEPHNRSKRELLGWVHVRPHRDYTFIRYLVKGEVGQVKKIGVNDFLRGLRLAQRMLEAMMAAEPQVQVWNTTQKTGDGVRLFGHMQTLYPEKRWNTGGLDRL